MAIETVFGHAGKPHVTGAQLARMLEGVVGGGDWVLPTQNRMKATMPDANTVRVDTGDIVHGGRLATCERYTDLTVESGTSGMRRHDIVAARFAKASDQHTLVVLKGAPSAGAASDPALKTGAPGVAAESDMPLYRVRLDGIVPTLEPMFRVAPTVAECSAAIEDTGWKPVWVNDEQTIEIYQRRIGGVVYLRGESWNGFRIETGAWRSITTCSAGFRPDATIHVAGTVPAADAELHIAIEASGLVKAYVERGSVGYWSFFASFPAAR